MTRRSDIIKIFVVAAFEAQGKARADYLAEVTEINGESAV